MIVSVKETNEVSMEPFVLGRDVFVSSNVALLGANAVDASLRRTQLFTIIGADFSRPDGVSHAFCSSRLVKFLVACYATL